MTISESYPFATAHDGKKIPIVDDGLGAKGELHNAVMVVGAEGGSTINVTIQLKDVLGVDLAKAASVWAFLSADAAGLAVDANAMSTAPAIGTDGDMKIALTWFMFLLTSEADGDIDIDFVDSGTNSHYLVLVMPNGRHVVSGVITHT